MKDNKKVLIITYYWPPSGGAGVQRWLKFSKYLPEFGWDPIVFTPENPQFDLKDDSLVAQVSEQVDVLKFPIWEPYGVFKKLTGTRELKQGQILEDSNNSLLKSLSVFLRGNLFVPDPKVFWVKPSVNYLSEILRSNEIKHVITTGPPHSLHLIGLRLKYQNPSITWLADFRDPWTEWDIMKRFKMLSFIRRKHEKLEKEVLKVADATLATGDQAAKDLKKIGARRVEVFTNGFDVQQAAKIGTNRRQEGTGILHLGMLNESRSPDLFFKLLDRELASQPASISIRFTGIISPVVIDGINQLSHLKERLQVQGSVPYEQLAQEYEGADVLLLLQTNTKEASSQLPGKLFEYLVQRKPILAFGDPESDVAQILKETQSGMMISYHDEKGIERVVAELNSGTFGAAFTYQGVEKYSRRNITNRLAELLNEFSLS